MTHVRRVMGFALIPLFTMASTILVLPLISSRFGQDGWSALGLGQSLGAFLSVIAGLAWHVIGAQQVAPENEDGRRIIYAESLKSRALVFMLLLPLAATLCLTFAPLYKWECVAFMVATGLNCLTASWFFAGTGQPKFVIRNEGMVRLSGYLLSIPALILFNSLWAYAIILIVTGMLMVVANSLSIFGSDYGSVWSQTRPVLEVIREQFKGMVSRTFSAGHQYLGVTIVSVVMPQGLPVYSALDNMQKSVNNATTFYPQSFAWWVGTSSKISVRLRRIRLLVLVTACLSLSIFTMWLVCGPLIMRLLYQDQANVSFMLHFWTALGMGAYTLSRALGQLGLVPLGLQSAVYRGTTVCAVIGLPGLVVGLWTGGIAGALAATGLAYAGLSVFYSCALFGGMHDYDEKSHLAARH